MLQWLANERASARDAAFAQAHLHECAECREELEAQRRLREAIRTDEAVVLAPQTSLQKLMQRIDASAGVDSAEVDTDTPRPTPAVAVPSSRPAVLRWSRWLPIVAGVQGLAIAMLLGTLWWQSREVLTAPRFTTLTSPTLLVPGPVIRVVFSEAVPLQEINDILRSIDAQIIAGPSDAGVYTLGLADSGRAMSMKDAVAKLRSDQRVVFSEVAAARQGSP